MADCALNGRRPQDKASCWVAPVQLAALPNAPETDMVPTRCGTEGSLQATCWREGLLVAHFVEKLPGASSPIFYLGKRAKSGAAFCMLPRKNRLLRNFQQYRHFSDVGRMSAHPENTGYPWEARIIAL
jgi:hypothetical protein